MQPKRVLTLHGFAAEFARDLRDRGIEAWALTEEINWSSPCPECACAESSFALLPRGFRPTGETPPLLNSKRSPRSAKRSPPLLRNWRRSAFSPNTCVRSTPEQLRIATRLSTGKAFAQTDPRTLQAGWAVIYRALLAAAKRGDADLRRIASSHGDAGKTAFEALEVAPRLSPLRSANRRALFESLHKARGPLAKTELLEARLQNSRRVEAQYVVKILTGDLRIGLREGLVEEAIARAFDAPLDDVKEANMFLGDIGQTALLARDASYIARSLPSSARSNACSPAPSRPRKPSGARFAQGTPNEAKPGSRAAQTSTDGPDDRYLRGRQVRWHPRATASRHRSAWRFSRAICAASPNNFDEIWRSEPRGFDDEVILDGEIMAFEHGTKLTFFDLQKRLGRKSDGGRFVRRAVRGCAGGLYCV